VIILKKFKNKGFVLVETVVVSAFVLLIFVLVFRNGVPMMEEYKKLENEYYKIPPSRNIYKAMTSYDSDYAFLIFE